MQKHYDFYVQCMQTGYLPNKKTDEPTGLCGAASFNQIDKKLLKIFEPTHDEDMDLVAEDKSTGWWAYGEPNYKAGSTNLEYGFTALRQTIVLFMACMAGEKF